MCDTQTVKRLLGALGHTLTFLILVHRELNDFSPKFSVSESLSLCSNSNPSNATLLPTKALLVHHLQKQDDLKLSEETYGKFPSFSQQPS